MTISIQSTAEVTFEVVDSMLTHAIKGAVVAQILVLNPVASIAYALTLPLAEDMVRGVAERFAFSFWTKEALNMAANACLSGTLFPENSTLSRVALKTGLVVLGLFNHFNDQDRNVIPSPMGLS